MGSSLKLTTMSLNLSFSHSHPSSSTPLFRGLVKLLQFNKFGKALKLSSTQSISGFPSFASHKLCTSTTAPRRLQSFNVFAAKGYKMKTHKASAKRFRVTGRGKIIRRRAGKQHLLAKKNTKRKLRLSKMFEKVPYDLKDSASGGWMTGRLHFFHSDGLHAVCRSDYDNVIGALPYLKVNRNAK
ncbi:50S ribosomal protein L35, chloroplastic [Gossypium australe]|uniref:50S ribosomal protein L35 n=1 Tax=Gossypium australe TaxID=47621 RepID=A0A5B6V4R0_9ROSI|nr:50S ribosomal protein L35, chloroplastic [Gossypium australe]